MIDSRLASTVSTSRTNARTASIYGRYVTSPRDQPTGGTHVDSIYDVCIGVQRHAASLARIEM